jgi:hypothetical protein
MINSFLYLIRSPWLLLSFAVYAIVAVGGGIALLRNRHYQSGPLFVRRRFLVALYLALTVTPSIITDFFVAGIYGTALVGFLFTIPGVFITDQSWGFLRVIALFYLLPVTVVFAVAYVSYPRISRLCSRHKNATNVA